MRSASSVTRAQETELPQALKWQVARADEDYDAAVVDPAGGATLGAAGVEVARDVLAETQSGFLPLVPFLDTLRWVFIALALAGIAVTIYARIDDWCRGLR